MDESKTALWEKLSDEEIIENVLSGDIAPFEQLIRRYNTRLFRIGVAYLRNESDVEDAMQDSYLKAFEKLSTFSGKSAFSTWLIQIMINESLMILRKRKKEPKELDRETYSDPPQISDLANQEMKEIFEQAVRRLPQQYRAIYIFREIEHYSTQETADLLNLSPENVRIRLFRSKGMLKEDLFSRVGREELFAFYRPKCDVLTEKVMRFLHSGYS